MKEEDWDFVAEALLTEGPYRCISPEEFDTVYFLTGTEIEVTENYDKNLFIPVNF